MKKAVYSMMTVLGSMAVMFATPACVAWYGKPETPKELLGK